MRNGETKTIGNATILCNVRRMSWVRREDKWMGRMAPRMSVSRTTYTVIGPDGKGVAFGVEGYRNAVKLAKTL
jgi:hypothetical protein